MKAKTVITVGKHGEPTIEGHGFSGETCLDTVYKLMRELGSISHQKKKDAYYKDEEIILVNQV